MLSRRAFLKGVAAGATALGVAGQALSSENAVAPNIIFILADDLGYADLGCYGANKVKTPNLDRIAQEGVRFTDAHSTASVCTPTRYAFMTGQYAWRNPNGDHILSGVAPLSIPPHTLTVASLLGEAGYATALIGKWHLGLGTKADPVDYSKDIERGPLDVGFDYAFFFAATGDRVPCVYIENRRVVGLDPADPIRVSYGEKIGDEPTGKEHPELLKMKADASHSQAIVNGISRIGYMSGGTAARWVDEEIADTLTAKAVAFIERNKSHPFFLYFAPNDIHEPMAPHARFKGTSGCGTRGDAIHELDWSVGAILAALDRLNLAENTLIVFASDNGGAIKDTYDDGTNPLHARQPPNGALRGDKGTLYEGGHRVPLLARWPGHIATGVTSPALIGLVDMAATFSAVAHRDLPHDAAPDSFDVSPAFTEAPNKPPVREHLVLQGNGARALALREGAWMLIASNLAAPGEAKATPPRIALYNLDDDIEEKRDLAESQRAKAQELLAHLEAIRAGAGTRP